MKPKEIDNFYLYLEHDQKANEAVREHDFENMSHLIKVQKESADKDFPEEDYVYDTLWELMSDEGDYVDSVEIEFLTSYSTTSIFYLREYCGVYWIDNLEQGNSMFYASEQDAKAAAKEEFGLDWDDPEASSENTEIAADSILNPNLHRDSPTK